MGLLSLPTNVKATLALPKKLSLPPVSLIPRLQVQIPDFGEQVSIRGSKIAFMPPESVLVGAGKAAPCCWGAVMDSTAQFCISLAAPIEPGSGWKVSVSGTEVLGGKGPGWVQFMPGAADETQTQGAVGAPTSFACVRGLPLIESRS